MDVKAVVRNAYSDRRLALIVKRKRKMKSYQSTYQIQFIISKSKKGTTHEQIAQRFCSSI